MRKRKNSEEESSSEMEVEDDEQKMEPGEEGAEEKEENLENDNDNDDDDEDDEELVQGDDDDDDNAADRAESSSPSFLDHFYGLSSSDPRERSLAAQELLHHCFVGPSSNSKDCMYTFKRLLNGLCSGRAAARQGNASALANFLKVSFQLKSFGTLVRDDSNENNTDSQQLSDLQYIRKRLLRATDPTQTSGSSGGKRKRGSEERDYQFGRLFGILALVRSNILTNNKNDEDDATIQEPTIPALLLSDLVELYWYKRWMQEPAAHGIITLLNAFTNHTTLYQELVEQVVIPKILVVKENEGIKNHLELLKQYTAEQLAIAIFIQSSSMSIEDLPFPLHRPLFTSQTIPMIGTALMETSSVVYPRIHLVWDTIAAYITQESNDSTNQQQQQQKEQQQHKSITTIRTLRPVIENEQTVDILDTLIRVVVVEKLLSVQQQEGKTGTTHERKALAMNIIKNLSGVKFISSITGSMQLLLPPNVLEKHILTPVICQELFVNVVCAGSAKKQSSQHLLKPMAIDVLQLLSSSSSSSFGQSKKTNDNEAEWKHRMAIVRALLQCDSRFDSRTKTTTIEDLLYENNESNNTDDNNATMVSKYQIQAWKDHVEYLQAQFLKECKLFFNESPSTNTSNATGYLEQLFKMAKVILSLDETKTTVVGGIDDGATDFKEFKTTTWQQIYGFFMTGAFFSCTDIIIASNDLTASGKKKKKGKNVATTTTTTTTATPLLMDIANTLKGQSKGIPLALRRMLSARFFSLLSEQINDATRHDIEATNTVKKPKDSATMEILTNVFYDCKYLESIGAKRHTPSKTNVKEDDDDDDNDEDAPKESPEEMMLYFIDKVQNLTTSTSSSLSPSATEEGKKRCATGSGVLALTLYLHLLNVGTAEESDNDMEGGDNYDLGDEYDEEEEQEIKSELADLFLIAKDFLDEATPEANPLAGLAQSCANILSSPLGSGNQVRGAGPRLVRDGVKLAWLGGLCLASSMSAVNKDKTLLDGEVFSLLLEAVGASNDAMNIDEDEDDDDDDDEDEMDDDVNDEEEVNETTNIDKNQSNDKNNDIEGDNSDESDSEMELDPNKLHSLLEEDSDASVEGTELEHHEGADAALAKMIKIKNESRKAGQEARERREMASQKRCVLLLEVLFTRPENWGTLFRCEQVLSLVTPLLNRRLFVERSIDASVDKVGHAVTSPIIAEKQAFLTGLTSLLKTKLCKMRLANVTCTKDVNLQEIATNLATELMNGMKKAQSKEHVSCCSCCLALVLRSIVIDNDRIDIATNIYVGAVEEWSTKRSGLEATAFDDFLRLMPNLAKVVLVTPMVHAIKNARTSFIKSEVLRLLQLLYTRTAATTTATKDGNTEKSLSIEETAVAKLSELIPTVIGALSISIEKEDSDTMKKVKRIKVFLKTIEKIVQFASVPHCCNEEIINSLGKIKKRLQDNEKFPTKENEGTKGMCEKLCREIETKVTELSAGPAGAGAADKVTDKNDNDRPMDTTTTTAQDNNTTNNASKKSKKKKKKKKK